MFNLASIYVPGLSDLKSDLKRNSVYHPVGKPLESMKFSHSQTKVVQPAVVEPRHDHHGADITQSRIRPVVNPIALQLMGHAPYQWQYRFLNSFHCSSPQFA
jgi:hypothetical protein